MIHFDAVRSNKVKSYLLLTFFVLLIVFLGVLWGIIYGDPLSGLVLALISSLIYALISYYAGGSMILSMTGAVLADKKKYPHLVHSVEGLAIAAGIPTPKIYVIHDTALNAFATGRDPSHAAVTVTTGLLKTLNREELEGVIAHEVSHIKNLDIRMMMLAAVMVGAVTLLSDFLLRSFLFGRRESKGGVFIIVGLVLAILSPIVGQLIKLAVSREREYMADASAAVLTRYPKGLSNALRKISNDPDPLVDNANKATAHLFISTPFRKKSGWLTKMFSTHPPIHERIKRLEGM
jgi:heat shock protein HtpX